MKALTCEMCGSTNLIKQDGVFVCQSCGTKYSLEEAKKMMVEGTVDVQGTVKVDTSDELKNLYAIARRAKNDNNDENALKYYDMIMVKDPNSWEATFFVNYYQTMTCKIGEIANAGYKLSHCLDSVCTLVKEQITDDEEKKNAINEIYARSITAADMLSGAASSHYDEIDVSIRDKFTQEYINNEVAARDICYILGEAMVIYFGEAYGKIAALAWKKGIEIHSKFVKYLQEKDENISVINQYADKIRKYEPEYVNPEVETSAGCYVATAVYGSYDCPEVWTLRRFRDNTLAETWYGRMFIRSYYAISPTLVKWFGHTQWFKKMWKNPLDKFVAKLQLDGVESTPYKDRVW